MRNAEFKELLTAMRESDHHQRKVLSTVLNRQSDGIIIIELIETSFDTKSSCPHCTNVELYRHGRTSGLQRYYCKHCRKTFNALTANYLGWRRAFEQHSQLTPETLLNAALGDFQHLTVT